MKPLMTYVRTTADDYMGFDYLHILAWNVDGKGGVLVLFDNPSDRPPMQHLDVLDMNDASAGSMGGHELCVARDDGHGTTLYKPIEPRTVRFLPARQFGEREDVHPDVKKRGRIAKPRIAKSRKRSAG